MTDLAVNWCAPIQGYLGYPIHARNLALALEEKGVDVTYFPIYGVGKKKKESPELEDVNPLVRKQEYKNWSLYNPTIRLSVANPKDMIQLGGRGKSIFYTLLELSKIPKDWVYGLKQVEEVWTPSHWSKEMISSSGVDEDKIEVVPEGVDSEMFKPTTENLIGKQVPDDGTFKFLNLGKFEKRKGQRVLAKAFAEEFEEDEPVSLYFQEENPFQDENVYQELLRLNMPKHPKIQPYKINLATEDMKKFYSSFDAFVNPSRGEGWCLPLIEAMACELPCITTNVTGMTEYVTEDNAFNIRTKGLEQVDVPLPGIEVEMGMQWYRPDKKHLQKQMRYVFEHRKEPRKRAKEGRKTAEKYSWERAAEKAIEALRKG